MKTVTVTFTKGDSSVTARLEYVHDSYPRHIDTTSKDGESFLRLGGNLPGMMWPLNSLRKHVEWQAQKMGATVVIEEDEGKVREWTDNLLEPS